MSKRHFIELADALRGLEIPADVLEALVSFCQAQNHRFKRGRWLAYLAAECGPSGGKVKTS